MNRERPRRIQILQGDCREVLKTLPDESVHCVVTSPPYWGLRDYGNGDGGIGLEPSVAEHIAALVETFREVRRVLRSDGTCWVNYGDAYCSTDKWGGGGNTGKQTVHEGDVPSWQVRQRKQHQPGLKPKDLIGLPWRLAFALQADGWWLRSDIIWHKPNPMPESVTDRPTRAHEYVFLLTKAKSYWYDAEAILEPASESTHARLAQNVQDQIGSARANGGAKTNGPMKAVGRKLAVCGDGAKNNDSFDAAMAIMPTMRNKRTVWTVGTEGFSEAHFATFPPALIEPCIKAGCPVGGTVLDPFGGAGTTGLVADRLQRNAILIELNPAYAEIAERRIHNDAPLLASLEVSNG